MVLVEFSIAPFDKGESVSPYVARALDVIDKSGLQYQLTPMGTILEGEWQDVQKVINDCFAKMSVDCDRVVMSMKVDYRKGKVGRLTGKIESVQNKLGRKLSV